MTVRLHLTSSELYVLDNTPYNSKDDLDKVTRVIRPKGHSLCHYSKLTYENGPLRFFSTLCHERSMGKYKKAVCSRNNPTLQIAKAARFQMLHFVNEKCIAKPKFEGKLVELKKFSFPKVTLPIKGTIHKVFNYNNMVLAPGLTICTDEPTNGWLTQANPPHFSIILIVFHSDDCLFLVTQKLTVVNFSRQHMAYEILEDLDCKLIDSSSVVIKKTFSTHRLNGKLLLFPDTLPYKEY